MRCQMDSPPARRWSRRGATGHALPDGLRYAPRRHSEDSRKVVRVRVMSAAYREASPTAVPMDEGTSVNTANTAFVSLYSGAGGLDLGFCEAGFRPVFAIDSDATAAETYSASYKRLADRLPHLRNHDHACLAASLDDHLDDLTTGAADLVIGGPPCQGFSVAGKMDPSDPRSRHVWRFIDAVERVAPRAFVMENVKALAVNRRWSALLASLRARAGEMGYETHILLLNAAHYGVPQSRERMFLIGMPHGTHFEAPLATTADSPPTLRWALSALPAWGAPGNDSLCTAKVTPARQPIMRRSPYAGMLFNGAGRPMRLGAPAPTLPASMGGNRTPIVDQHHLDGIDDCWVMRYHAHLAAGGEPYMSLPDRLRRLTVQEAAAVQGFPADMEWRGRQSAVYRQIGNAVPPSLARAVAVAVKDALEFQCHAHTTHHNADHGVLGQASERRSRC